MKVALVHDYLREYGGAERVVEALHEIFPEAPIYTAYFNPQGLGVHASRISKWDIRTSWLQKVPFANKLVSPFRVFAPMIFESFNLSDYDVVISSSAIYFAKAVLTSPNTLHISYIHTPPRYLYGYVTSYNYKKHWWTRIGGEIANHFLRIWDFEVSQRPDILIANSKNVAERIKKFYRREPFVIYPPVDLNNLLKQKKVQGDYYLSLGRLVRGKGVDVIIEACTRLNLPLKVAGSGPLLKELKKKAGKNIEFLGQVPDQERQKLFAEAEAFIVASEDEDFGITQIESMAAGTPVIAINSGGYKESIISGKTGELFNFVPNNDPKKPFNEETVQSLMTILGNFDPTKYKEDDLRKSAEKFSKENFKKEVLELIDKNFKG